MRQIKRSIYYAVQRARSEQRSRRWTARLQATLWGACLLVSLSAAAPARAEFTLIDRAEAWFFYMQRGVGHRYAACQVVSCPRGVCGPGASARTQFSLYDARDGHGALPEFISPRRADPGAQASLVLNGEQFPLVNPFGSPQFFLQAHPDAAGPILQALQALEAQDALGRFTVRDPDGREHVFTVRGITQSLERMERRCTQRY